MINIFYYRFIWKRHILPPDVLKDDYKKYVPQYNGYRYRLSKVRRGLCCPSEDWTLNYLKYFLNTFFLNQFKKFTKYFIAYLKNLFYYSF